MLTLWEVGLTDDSGWPREETEVWLETTLTTLSSSYVKEREVRNVVKAFEQKECGYLSWVFQVVNFLLDSQGILG